MKPPHRYPPKNWERIRVVRSTGMTVKLPARIEQHSRKTAQDTWNRMFVTSDLKNLFLKVNLKLKGFLNIRKITCANQTRICHECALMMLIHGFIWPHLETAKNYEKRRIQSPTIQTDIRKMQWVLAIPPMLSLSLLLLVSFGSNQGYCASFLFFLLTYNLGRPSYQLSITKKTSRKV